MKKSEEKKRIVLDLALQYKKLNVKRLIELPDHRGSKGWLAEVAAIFKNLDESDFKSFLDLRQHLYPSIPFATRKHAAEQIDGFVRQKVAEYQRYDFSDLDKFSKDKTTGILNEGYNNTFINVSSEGFDIGLHDKGKGTLAAGGKHVAKRRMKAKWWEQNWFQAIALFAAIIGIFGFILSFIL